MKHAFETKLQIPLRGEQCSWSKLKKKQIAMIRVLYDEGVTQKRLALHFKISRRHISDIVNNKVWKEGGECRA